MNSHSTIKIMLLAAGLSLCGPTTAGGRPMPNAAQPMIAKVAMNHEKNAIIITGRYFGNTSPPSVHLAGQELKIKRFTESEVAAALPPGIRQATYRLTVTANGHKRATSDVFSASLANAAHAIER